MSDQITDFEPISTPDFEQQHLNAMNNIGAKRLQLINKLEPVIMAIDLDLKSAEPRRLEVTMQAINAYSSLLNNQEDGHMKQLNYNSRKKEQQDETLFRQSALEMLKNTKFSQVSTDQAATVNNEAERRLIAEVIETNAIQISEGEVLPIDA